MRLRASSLFVVAATAMAFAVPADAQNLKQVATIQIPGTPINQFGSLTIDQASGLIETLLSSSDSVTRRQRMVCDFGILYNQVSCLLPALLWLFHFINRPARE